MKTIHLIIQGKVQGVFYRATAKDVADELGLKGWVKNTEDGNVESTVSGTEEQLAEFVEWCWKGPSRANVINVTVNEAAPETFETFKVIRGK